MKIPIWLLEFECLSNQEPPCLIFIWDAGDPLRLRIATRLDRGLENALDRHPIRPIVGIMEVMGVPKEFLIPGEEEALLPYIERLLPAFLGIVEALWGTFTNQSAADALHTSNQRSAREMMEIEISLDVWLEGTRH